MRINPAQREAQSEIHRCEPYVYAQTIAGKDASDHGRARNSWLTGTASWTYVATTQWILGIRPSFDGLTIDPCLPKSQTSCRVIRQFRGATYDIRISNESNSAAKKRSIDIDGAPFSGDILPVFADGQTHIVSIVQGDTS